MIILMLHGKGDAAIIKEGLIAALILLVVGNGFLFVGIYLDYFWYRTVAILFFIICFVIIFSIILVSSLKEKKGVDFIYIFYELIFLYVAIPIFVLLLTFIPMSIYLVFFDGSAHNSIMIFIVLTVLMQIISLVYIVYNMWKERRKSGIKLKKKEFKGYIEDLETSL